MTLHFKLLTTERCKTNVMLPTFDYLATLLKVICYAVYVAQKKNYQNELMEIGNQMVTSETGQYYLVYNLKLNALQECINEEMNPNAFKCHKGQLSLFSTHLITNDI